MQRFTSAALSILVAFGVMLSLTTAASANPLAGGGFSSSYAGESVFTQNQVGETGQMSAIFFNDGSQSWSPGVVGLLICAADKVTCNVPGNQTFAKNWFSSTVYATVTTTVGAGQNGFFVYDFTVPVGTPVGTVTTFYGDVGLIATGDEFRPQGYFQVNTVPTPTITLTLAPTSASVAVGATQQFTVSGAPSGSTVTWSVTGGCGAVTNNGLFASTAMNSASQPCNVTASVGGATATAAVSVYGPAASLGCSAIPTTIVANGGTTGGTATAYVTLKDANGNTVSNGTTPITLTNVTPSLGTVTPTGTVGATNGVATTAVASTLASGTIQISASATSLTGCNVQITSGAPGSSAATKTTFTSNPIAADAVSTTTLRVDVTDVNGNRNTSDNSTVVSVSRDSGANVCNIIGVITGSAGSFGTSNGTATAVQGRVEFRVQATSVPGTCTFTTTTNNTSVAGSSGSLVTQITGVANKLTVSSNDSPHPAAATGGTCTTAGTGDTNASCTHIVVGVRDANGSLITSDTGRAITATFDTNSCSGAGGGVPAVVASTTTSGGLATFAIASRGAYASCNITFAATGISGVNATAVWTPGGVTQLTCAFTPTPIVSDGASTSTGAVTAADANGNAVTSGTLSVNFSRTAGATTTLLTANPQSTTSGVAYFIVKSQTTPGTDTYTPSVASGTSIPATSCLIRVN